MIIEIKYHKKRIDFVLQNELKMSRTFVIKLINDGLVKINNSIDIKPGTIVNLNDIVDVSERPRIVLDDLNYDLNLKVLFEDSELLVIDKPSGISVHNAYHSEFNVLDDVMKKYPEARLINRIDKGTSGCLLIGKTDNARAFYASQFENRVVHKEYLAVVDTGIYVKLPSLPGVMTIDDNSFQVETKIHRNKNDRTKMMVHDLDGKLSVTEFLKSANPNLNSEYTIIQAFPKTGRTHQIRVHLKYLGYPILGDTTYGGKEYSRLMLHARSIDFKNRDGDTVKITADIPVEFNEFLDNSND